MALAAVLRRRTDRERAQNRLLAAQDAYAAVAADDADDIDPLLDFFAGLRAELSGRVGHARGDVKRLNAVVMEFFDGVTLTAVEDGGVEIRPYLSAVAVERILRDTDADTPDADGWPDAGVPGHPPPLRELHAPSGPPRTGW